MRGRSAHRAEDALPVIHDKDEPLLAGVARLREGGWSITKVFAVLIGLVLTLAVLVPIVALDAAAWLAGVLGHVIREHVTQRALNTLIGLQPKCAAWMEKRMAQGDDAGA